jgi:hypothetical protein
MILCQATTMADMRFRVRGGPILIVMNRLNLVGA